jgi:hypothetical protein
MIVILVKLILVYHSNADSDIYVGNSDDGVSAPENRFVRSLARVDLRFIRIRFQSLM